eukprot:6194637-Pleurochrysis_carterae.AAC.1
MHARTCPKRAAMHKLCTPHATHAQTASRTHARTHARARSCTHSRKYALTHTDTTRARPLTHRRLPPRFSQVVTNRMHGYLRMRIAQFLTVALLAHISLTSLVSRVHDCRFSRAADPVTIEFLRMARIFYGLFRTLHLRALLRIPRTALTHVPPLTYAHSHKCTLEHHTRMLLTTLCAHSNMHMHMLSHFQAHA